ncbi:hypothetical protein Esti_003865 [Eimeria stiedai]
MWGLLTCGPRAPFVGAPLGPPPHRTVGGAPRQLVRLYERSQKWDWNPYAGGLGCSTMLGAPPAAGELEASRGAPPPNDIEGLRALCRNEVAALSTEHELLLFDLQRLNELTQIYRDKEGRFLLSPPPEILEAKKGVDLRLEQFKDDCGRCERLQRRLQRLLDRGREAGGSAGFVSSPEAIEANCRLLKKVQDQRRLISMLQRDLDERLYEQSLMEEHLKRLTRAADHLPWGSPGRGPPRGGPREGPLPPTLHQRQKEVPNFQTDWLRQIRFAAAPLPRVPTKQPPIPAATVKSTRRLSSAAAAAAAADKGLARRLSRKDKRPSEAGSLKAASAAADAAEEEGLLPRVLKSFWRGGETAGDTAAPETAAAADTGGAAAAARRSSSSALQRLLSGGLSLVVTGAQGDSPGSARKRGGPAGDDGSPRSPREGRRPHREPLARGDSKASLVRGASRTLASPREAAGRGAAPPLRQGSRTLPSPRGPLLDAEGPLEEGGPPSPPLSPRGDARGAGDTASITRSLSRQGSRTLTSPRGAAAAAVEQWTTKAGKAAAGIERKETRTLLSPRDSLAPQGAPSGRPPAAAPPA